MMQTAELTTHIPLARAMLCLDCEQVYDWQNKQCPACSNTVSISVKELIEHGAKEQS